MNVRNTLVCCAAISFLFHGAGLMVSNQIPVQIFQGQFDVKKEPFKVKLLNEKQPQKLDIPKQKITEKALKESIVEKLSFQAPSSPDSNLSLNKNIAKKVEEEKKVLEKVDLESTNLPEVDTGDAVTKKQESFYKPDAPQKRNLREDVFIGQNVGSIDADVLVSAQNESTEPKLQGSLSEKEFSTEMPAFTPQIVDLSNSSRFEITAEPDLIRNTDSYIPEPLELTDLNQFLIFQLSTFQDPQDQQKYFKIGIRAGQKALDLPSLPKEVVFLVDSSLSMKDRRLAKLKEGLQGALRNLNPDDLFNIYAFKEEIIPFRPYPVSPTESFISEGLRFVNDIESGESTDAYHALKQTIAKRSFLDPTYLFFISDGRPTQGVRNSTKIIQDISDYNDGRKAIFSFGGGPRVNRYLLDFISYKNRGWAEYSPRTHRIDDAMERMIGKLKDPILTNLSYKVANLGETEIFPKVLPDFFRNAEFTLYGKYSDEKDFLFRLIGDSKDKRSEFIIAGDLSKAPQGDPSIARNWAFNKIYHLIGLLETTNDPQILREIQTLSTKFNIQTPYDQSFFEF